jgi:hypothetical protein
MALSTAPKSDSHMHWCKTDLHNPKTRLIRLKHDIYVPVGYHTGETEAHLPRDENTCPESGEVCDYIQNYNVAIKIHGL